MEHATAETIGEMDQFEAIRRRDELRRKLGDLIREEVSKAVEANGSSGEIETLRSEIRLCSTRIDQLDPTKIGDEKARMKAARKWQKLKAAVPVAELTAGVDPDDDASIINEDLEPEQQLEEMDIAVGVVFFTDG